MSTPVTAVTFDCWGTLISDSGFDRAMARRVDAIAEACGVDGPQAADILERAWKEHHAAWLDVKQYGSSGMARFCVTELGVDDDAVCARLTEALEEAGRAGSQHALEGAVDTLETLRSAGIRTALVCDAGFTPGRVVRDFLAEHGLIDHLEFLAFSNEVGVPKPDPRIFRVALEAIGVTATDAVHVGDLLRTDVFGARSLGMGTIRITQSNDDAVEGISWSGPGDDVPYLDADVVVAAHADIPAALRELGANL